MIPFLGRACLFLLLLSALGCDNKSYKHHNGNLLIRSQEVPGRSSTAGNLMATAIKETHNLDVVFYPTTFINSSERAILSADASHDEFAQQALYRLYPSSSDLKDQFKLGTMSGEDIKEFIFQRSKEFYDLELEVAGVEYHLHFVGGVPRLKSFSRERDVPLIDDQYYRVAVSEYYFFNGTTFPGYKYRNSMNFSFTALNENISAQESLATYLKGRSEYPYFDEIRAQVSKSLRGHAGSLEIHQIQGNRHLSPVYGHTVTTRGVVTAVGSVQWYPGGVDVIIQSVNPDADPATSEGLRLHFDEESIDYQLGDFIEVSGVVYEEITSTGLGTTGLREISSHKKLATGLPLPEPVELGAQGRAIPWRHISTYRGNLNLKSYLNLNDGVDFWESLESMRIKIRHPRVVGFRGGQEEFESLKPKTYLNLFVKPDGNIWGSRETPRGGVIVDEEKQSYNPDIVQIISNHLTKPFDVERFFTVGMQVDGSVEGVLIYEKNLFGDGEYVMVLPEHQPDLLQFVEGLSEDPILLSDPGRPKSTLTTSPSHLTVATINVENLAGYQLRRLEETARSVQISMACPDIVNFVEIQDENGQDFEGDGSAEVTLQRLVEFIDCDKNYRWVNIDPIANAEGGQPGGNIRMAMIYDADKISFTPRRRGNPLEEVLIDSDGSLNNNPGRIFPDDRAFRRSRRSLVAEFQFKGEKIFVIGNHFNSKLGESSRWGAQQPPSLTSENKRTKIADRIRAFVEILKIRSPGSHVLVVGDFNALVGESSMNVLEAAGLHNLIKNLPSNERYTANYNGGSQALDHIFASHSLLSKNPEVEVVNINSDFMGRISDHDPVVARFQF